MHNWPKRLLVIPAFGAVLVSFSEFWFYPVTEEVSHVGILVAYGLLGYLFLVVLERFRVSNWAGFIVASALLGFLIEGVPVPVVYSAPPFTIVWTSMAWHGLLTLFVGWVAFKHVMLKGSPWQVIAFGSVLGMGLGLWNSYMWHAVEDESTGSVSFDWEMSGEFAKQCLTGYGLFVSGHAVFERVWGCRFGASRWEHVALWFLCATVAGLVALASGLGHFFPILPCLVGLCLWALQRQKREGTWDPGPLTPLFTRRIVPRRYLLTPVIPLVAIATYSVCVQAQVGLEMNAYLILTAGPLSVGAFCWAWWRAQRAPHQDGTPS